MARQPIIYVFVCGIDYQFIVRGKAADWTRTSQSRERYVLNRTRARPLIFLTFDIPSGKLIEKRYGEDGGAPITTPRSDWLPVKKSDFKERPVGPTEKEAVFAGDVKKHLSAIPIYREILAAVARTGGKIGELSVFCHATSSGPILANTWEHQRVENIGGVNALVRVAGYGSSERDPNDFDFRADDFRGNRALSDDDLRAWRTAFSPDGFAWIWGCNEDHRVKMLFRAIKGGKPSVTRSTKDETKITMTLKDYQILAIKDVDDSLLISTPKKGVYEIRYGSFRSAILRLMRGTFAQSLSSAVGRTVYSAAPGTAADYHPKNKVDMIIDSGSQEIVFLYKKLFGSDIDPQNLGYIAYKPEI